MRRVLMIATILGLAAAPTSPCLAVDVECINCSQWAQQLLDYARQAQQLATETSTLQTQLRQYSNMVTNTISLPQEVWATVQSDIMQVRNLTNAASLLTGNSGSILTRLGSANAYGSQVGNLPTTFGSQVTSWQQTLGNASTSLGRTLAVQQGQENSYTAVQQALQQHSQTAAGQMQAIQAGNEMAALTNTQLNQIQTTLVAQAQMLATKDAVEADRRATEDAAMLQAFTYKPMSMTGNTSY